MTIAVMLFLSIFSSYAGLKLWEKKPNADKIAKIFLIVQLSLIIMILGIRLLMPFSIYGYADTLKIIITGLIPAISYFIVWYLYLSYSRRVRNTYECLA
jgi:uncharacterized membrane protein